MQPKHWAINYVPLELWGADQEKMDQQKIHDKRLNKMLDSLEKTVETEDMDQELKWLKENDKQESPEVIANANT